MRAALPSCVRIAPRCPKWSAKAGLFIDPEVQKDMAASIERLVQDSTLRKDLSAKGLRQAARFSWDRMAEQTLRVYEQCLS